MNRTVHGGAELAPSADGRRKHRPSLGCAPLGRIAADAALCLGDGRDNDMLAGRKETMRKLYLDAYAAFRRLVGDAGVDPGGDGRERLSTNVLGAFVSGRLPTG